MCYNPIVNIFSRRLNGGQKMAKQKNIPKRSEVEKQYTWALEDIFATDELWEKALDECRTFPEKIEAFRGRLAESADMLSSYLTFCD